jgi:molybdopterin converting factor small subunit
VTVLVAIPAVLRRYTDGATEVPCAGETVRDLLRDLDARHAGVAEAMLDERGALRRYVHVFVNGDDVRALEGLSTPTPRGAYVSIVTAVAGG